MRKEANYENVQKIEFTPEIKDVSRVSGVHMYITDQNKQKHKKKEA